MKRVTLFLVAAVVGSATCEASLISMGVYAIIDSVKVVDESRDDATVIVRGVFVLPHRYVDFSPPKYGYMYFSLPKAKADRKMVREEWAKLKQFAGTGLPIAFGHRWPDRRYMRTPVPLGTVRKPNDQPAKPDPYPITRRLRKMKPSARRPIRDLLYFPTPQSPAEGEIVNGKTVTLVANRIASNDDKVKYVFELVKPDKKKLTSKPITASAKQVRWTPPIELEPGRKYIWRVWVISDAGSSTTANAKPRKGPTASTSFRRKPIN